MLDSDPKLLDKQIAEFSCVKDPDVESFLKEKAIIFERSGISRTYFYAIDDEDSSEIVAYFSVAITATSFEGIGKSKKSKILGSTPYRDFLDHFGGLLVAQLARCDRYTSDDINGTVLIKAAEKTIEQGRVYLGGRVLYLDCKAPLIPLYEENDYQLLRPEPYTNGLYKMFKMMPKITSR
jgi:hypothetical protein